MGQQRKELKKPSVGDTLHHVTANGWYEEATVLSVQSYGDVWRALLMTSSEGTVVLGTGAMVRDKNDWDIKTETASSASPSKKRRMKNTDVGSA